MNTFKPTAPPAHAAPASCTPFNEKTVTFLFTDIESSTRLWESDPKRMGAALAAHDRMARTIVAQHGGTLVKMTGDGLHAAFDHAPAAVDAVLALQLSLAAEPSTQMLAVRCGLHAGRHEQRDQDYFGPAVNRAARVMSAAHGGQVLLSQSVVDRLGTQLPPEVSLNDLGAVRLRDLTTPEHLYQLVHPKLRAAFPPLRSLASVPNNLPQQLSSFIGRARELAYTKTQLAKTRLLTLTGMGGIGKSRLSLQLAAEALESFADGVWLVELAGLEDAASVPQALATVLGVQEAPGQSILDALVAHVQDKCLLVILDNCEHVIGACAQLAKRLLQAGPQVKVLATSRDVLRVSGEVVYPVPTLSAPDPNQTQTPERLAAHEAARLFIDRVTAVQPGFVVNETNLAAVANICHRLDGIPLALELAAARARALSVEYIAARLDDRFKLLASGDHTVLPRQRTLRALIDWSYDLLSAPERLLFERLAVFAGHWTLEAAQTVCVDTHLAAEDLVDIHTQLVEKSLVSMQADGARYRMLDTVRHYALEKLDAAGLTAETRTQHLHYMCTFAQTARAHLAGAEQGLWLAQLDAERDNLLGAHAWALQAPHMDQGLQLITALRPYWLARGLLTLGHRLTVDTLAHVPADRQDLARCNVLADAGLISCFMGRYAEAQAFLTEALTLARALEQSRLTQGILQALSMVHVAQQDWAAARECTEEAVTIARALGQPRELVAALNALAQLHRAVGALDQAEPLYQDAVALARQLKDEQSVAIGLLNLAMVSIGNAHCDQARIQLAEALHIANKIGVQPVVQSALEVCAGLASTCAQWNQATRYYGYAQAHQMRTGLQRDPVDDAFLAPLMARAQQAMGHQAFDQAIHASCAQATEHTDHSVVLSELSTWLQTAETTPSLTTA